jgi:hypothetical protein
LGIRRLFFSLALVASLAVTLGASAPAPRVPVSARPTPYAKAPADEYFGRLKISMLGINNMLHDDSIRAGASTTDERLIHDVADATDALRDWARKYPRDPQLARSCYLAFAMYRKILTRDAQEQAWHFLNIVVQRWPSSYFGKLARNDIALGFTERYYAAPQPCPTPTLAPTPSPAPTPAVAPTPSPTPTAKPRHGLFASSATRTVKATPSPTPMPTPSPSPSPSPTPSPTPTPTPAPTEAPRPGQPRIELIPAPCSI